MPRVNYYSGMNIIWVLLNKLLGWETLELREVYKKQEKFLNSRIDNY